MTDDIVTRLRESADGWEECGEHDNAALEREAADRIERLRAALAERVSEVSQMGNYVFDVSRSKIAMEEEIERLRASLIETLVVAERNETGQWADRARAALNKDEA